MEKIIIGNKIGSARIAVGKGLTTKINFIVGTNSKNKISVKNEKRKIDLAAEFCIDTITDLSTVRLDIPLWKYVKEKYPWISVGINPPYLPYIENKHKITPKKLFHEIENFIKNGGDFMTMNFIPRTLYDLESRINKRGIPITSRQGGMLAEYMIKNRKDNPYYEILDELLLLLKKYEITVNIGSTFRPAGIIDANDMLHNWETKKQMEIYDLFEKHNIKSLVEIMSHQLLSQIGKGILTIRKKYGEYVPFQFLGPIVTDIASGQYDYIASTIGAAEASRYNVGKVTVIPAREHTGFPTIRDIKLGIIATKIAVHAGDISRIPNLKKEDAKILKLRTINKSCNPFLKIKGCNKCGTYCPLILVHNAKRYKKRYKIR